MMPGKVSVAAPKTIPSAPSAMNCRQKRRLHSYGNFEARLMCAVVADYAHAARSPAETLMESVSGREVHADRLNARHGGQ